jgi:hypothetical protein
VLTKHVELPIKRPDPTASETLLEFAEAYEKLAVLAEGEAHSHTSGSRFLVSANRSLDSAIPNCLLVAFRS